MRKQGVNGIPSEDRVISTIFSGSVASMIVGGIASFIGNIVDGLIIARRLGTVCMSAYQLVIPILSVISMLTLFFSAGVQNKYSEYLGSGKKDQAHAIFSMSATVMAIIGVLLPLAMLLFPDFVARLLGASEENGQLFAETVAYIRGLAPGIPAMLLIPLFGFLLYIEGQASTMLLSTALMVVIDVIGDFAAVFVFHSGMLGIGLASSLCYIVAGIVSVICFNLKPHGFHFRLRGTGPTILLPVLRMGLPTGIERLLVTLQMTMFNKTLMGISVEAVAIYSVLQTLNMVIQPVAEAVSGTTFTMTSVFVGEEDGNSIRILFRQIVRKTVIVGFSIAAILFVLSTPLMALFMGRQSAELNAAGAAALRLFILYFPFYTFIRAYHKYIQAVGFRVLTYIIPILEYAVLFIPAVRLLSDERVWIAFAAAEILTAAVILIVPLFKRGAGEKDAYVKALRRIPKSLERNPADDYNVTIGADMRAVIGCSEAIGRALTEGQSGERVAYLISLVVEEMCGNIVKFNPGKANLSMDVRMIAREGYHIIRIRDNGKPFNPEQWASIHESDDKLSGIGIRMVAGFAEKFTYTNILGMNNLTICVRDAKN